MQTERAYENFASSHPNLLPAIPSTLKLLEQGAARGKGIPVTVLQ